MAFDTKDWKELYEGAREAFGPAWAAIFMRAMEPSLRDDLATKTDLAGLGAELRVEMAGFRTEMADLRAAIESKLRGQTWTMVTVLIAGIGASRLL